MIGLNLLPDVKKEYLKAQSTRNTAVSIAILSMLAAGGVVVMLAISVYAGQGLTSKLYTDSIKDKESELHKKPEIDKYLTIQNQLQALETLHDEKFITSRIFDYLQKLNPIAPNSITVSSVQVSKSDKSILLEGSVGDFKGLDVFKNTLEKAKLKYQTVGSDDTPESQEVSLFKEVVLESAGLGRADSNQAAMVSFKFVIAYDDVIFAPESRGVEVIVPRQLISDSDQNAPKELFKSQETE